MCCAGHKHCWTYPSNSGLRPPPERPKLVRTFMFLTFSLGNVLRPQPRAILWHLNFQKWFGPGVFCASDFIRATTKWNFFDIRTAKDCPRPSVLLRFDFDTCFPPQRRVIFRHPNFQEWFETEVFCAFWLGNVLRATAACNCSFLIWAHGSPPAASRPTNHKINKMFRDFPNISRACFLVLLALSVSLFYLFSILLFSDLYFPYCRKFGLF